MAMNVQSGEDAAQVAVWSILVRWLLLHHDLQEIFLINREITLVHFLFFATKIGLLYKEKSFGQVWWLKAVILLT
jgi:hypothetical protein